MRLRLVLALGLSACSILEPEPLPPRGEALLVVDTDLPVPRVVSRLRVDITTEDGRWIATRDDPRLDPRDWPTSFSVYAEDDGRPHVLLVRLRAYPDARVVGYRGQDRVEGAATPEVEPDPSLTVDRTVRVELVTGRRGRLRVTLPGACVGAPCDDAPAPALEPTMDRAVPTAAGTFASAPCDGVTPSSGRTCVPGGAFVFGDRFYRPSDTIGSERPVGASPERVVALSRFVMDMREVTVARYRDAIARGFVAPYAPKPNEVDGPPTGNPLEACTWSAAPRGREDHPLSCVTWDTARAFCAFEGGDLPTEAQWEYAALAAGRGAKAAYPWGDDPPACDRAIYGRALAMDECIARGEGLPPTTAGSGDVSAIGIRDLAGSVEEYVKDDHARLTDACWTGAPSLDPVCTIPPPAACVPDLEAQACRFGPGIVKSVRGGSWFSSALDLHVVDRERAHRLAKTTDDSTTGFRCVYPAP